MTIGFLGEHGAPAGVRGRETPTVILQQAATSVAFAFEATPQLRQPTYYGTKAMGADRLTVRDRDPIVEVDTTMLDRGDRCGDPPSQSGDQHLV